MNLFLQGLFWTKNVMFLGETYLYNTISSILMKNSFGDSNYWKVGCLTKKLRKTLDGWKEQLDGGWRISQTFKSLIFLM
jgi:hypothetical protein